ncbi:MAG TPA: GTPase Era, partial [Clostridia bacterium]|nr:GTPase Era [Clostridia bacterium]
GFIAVVGRPNVGKSTLINTLAGKKVSIISEKPQTTKNMVRAIITNENSQLILMDTPGIHKPKSKLGEFMVKRAVDSINDADGVIFVVEASDLGPGKTDSMIMERLRGIKPPVILVVNKCDAASEERILNTIASFSSNMEFHEVVPVSALNGDNTDVVLDIARKLLPEGMMYFDGEDYTDQPERTIAAEYIREKILLLLRDEIPHGTGVEITKFHDREDKDIIDIDATIFCERKSHKGILIGKNGSMLKKIGSMARADLQALFGIPVFLQLWVKVKEDWRNTNSVLKDLGYKE